MKIYKYEFSVDESNQHDWYKSRVTHSLHILNNTKSNRELFINDVGVCSNDFLLGISSNYAGYQITEIEVVE